ncbi:MAG: CCA tRNA nucleotidyltransferase [Christensenellales bacterium]|jgi:tRNA nucleotidyltransferase (CCA-adding enzyme)
MIPAPVEQLAAAFQKSGHSLFAVGGMVRNPLLGFPISDMDVTTDALPEESLKIGEELGLIAIPKAVQFGTVELIAPDKSWSVECTTFRADVYGPGGFHRPTGVRFSKDLESDAFRRDFTVNAIYQNALTGDIVDPTGGMEDLKNRLLRATSKDPCVIMGDDGLRVLRLVRFACELGFDIEPKTRDAAKEFAEGLADIPAERKYAELKKILLSDVRYHAPQPRGEHAVLRALNLMRDLGSLQYVIPELLEGENVAQNPQYHAYDVMNHAFMVAASTPPELVLRLAGLLHDIAKPVVFHKTGRMHGHESEGAKIAREILARLKVEKAVTERVCSLIRWHMYDLDGRAREKTLKKQFVQWGKAFVLDLATLREADVIGSGISREPESTAQRWRRVLSEMIETNTPFSENELDITGQDIAALGFLGKQIGEVKRALWMHCAVHPNENQNKRLIRLARGMGKRFHDPALKD